MYRLTLARLTGSWCSLFSITNTATLSSISLAYVSFRPPPPFPQSLCRAVLTANCFFQVATVLGAIFHFRAVALKPHSSTSSKNFLFFFWRVQHIFALLWQGPIQYSVILSNLENFFSDLFVLSLLWSTTGLLGVTCDLGSARLSRHSQGIVSSTDRAFQKKQSIVLCILCA